MKSPTAYSVAARIEAIEARGKERAQTLIYEYAVRVEKRIKERVALQTENLLSTLEGDERAKAERIMSMAPNPIREE